jgi:hypothetical protein
MFYNEVLRTLQTDVCGEDEMSTPGLMNELFGTDRASKFAGRTAHYGNVILMISRVPGYRGRLGRRDL